MLNHNVTKNIAIINLAVKSPISDKLDELCLQMSYKALHVIITSQIPQTLY